MTKNRYFNKNKINFVAWGKTKNKKNYSWVDLDNHNEQ